MYSGWRELHYNAMCRFIRSINFLTSDLVLKGGASLMMCYGSDRFAEGIQFDAASSDVDILGIITDACRVNKFRKTLNDSNVDSQWDLSIHYGGDKPIPVKVYYGRKQIDVSEYCIKDNICTYHIDSILMRKINKFLMFGKLHDLSDIAYIYLEYGMYGAEGIWWAVRSQLIYSLTQRGLGWCSRAIETQQDDSIDRNKLASDFERMCDSLGLIRV